MQQPRIRPAVPSDCAGIARLCAALWPEASAEEFAEELLPKLAGTPQSTLPLTIFVAKIEGHLAGFVEVGLRSHADGCDTRQPVGFLEGWFVEEAYRRRGIGAALVAAAEDWARAQGCAEMASDTWADHQLSQDAHEALRFEVVDRCVHYKKRL